MQHQRFIPEGLTIRSKEDLLPFYHQLLERTPGSKEEFAVYLQDVSALESRVSEEMAWRYIRMTCDTLNKDHEAAYLAFVNDIQPHLAPLDDELNRKITSSTFLESLEGDDPAYHIYFRSLKGAVELFREENIPLEAELQSLAQKYSGIQGAMSVTYQGEEMTMQKAGNFLMSTQRAVRKEVYELMAARRLESTQSLEDLFDEMVQKRHAIAVNAGFDNYRDYKFKALGRYDYQVEDCLNFHHAIETRVVPLLKALTASRKQKLGLETLKPWDMAVDPDGNEPLKPFSNGDELLNKGIACMQQLDSFFAHCLQTMKEKSLLDLESRKGKAPGGYNYPLAETNLPFIFMNATGNLRDLETLVHEAGHAVHSFLMAPLPLNAFKNTPSEVAELASMSMELLTMNGWKVFFPAESDWNRARKEQLEGIIATLPWIATVDAFQHWIYENPQHTRAERKAKWLELNERFGTGMVDYAGFEEALAYSWHKQLHIFEVPFYYIEYGFAQLGAIAVWKKYVENGALALEDYKNALKLGYTRSIPEVYQQAGIEFNFSDEYVGRLFQFLSDELQKVQ